MRHYKDIFPATSSIHERKRVLIANPIINSYSDEVTGYFTFMCMNIERMQSINLFQTLSLKNRQPLSRAHWK